MIYSARFYHKKLWSGPLESNTNGQPICVQFLWSASLKSNIINNKFCLSINRGSDDWLLRFPMASQLTQTLGDSDAWASDTLTLTANAWTLTLKLQKMQAHSRKCFKFYYNYALYSSGNVVATKYVFKNKYCRLFNVFPQETHHLPLCLHVATVFGAPTQYGRHVCIHRLMSGNGVGQSRLSISMGKQCLLGIRIWNIVGL